jgi:peptide/nickel transport system substrate-binding protein
LTSGTLTTLDPIAATDSSSTAVIEHVFDGLTTFPDGGTRARLQLASDISVAGDDRTYTVTLKPGATFHDGSQVTASSVAYSWERLAASDNSRRSYLLFDMLGVEHDTRSGEYVPGSLGVRALDSRSLEFTLAEPFAATRELLALPAFAPVPQGIVGDIDGYSGRMSYTEFATGPTGSGPFVLDRWRRNVEVLVSRFADYHGQAADLDAVHWQVLTDSDAAYTYGQNRNADFVSIPDSEYDPDKRQVTRTDDIGRRFGSYGPMGNDETVSYLSTPTVGTFYVAFNTDSVVKPVRQALAYALNQQEIVDQVLDGRAMPAYHFTPPAVYPDRDYESHASGSYPYGYDSSDIAAARQVMEDAGYGPNNQYALEFTHYASETWRRTGTILRDKLANAHVDMRLEEVPFSTLINRGRNGNLEAYALGYVADYPGADDVLENIDPPNTDYSTSSARGAYINWQGTAAAADAADAWDRVESNQGPGTSPRGVREAAYVTMEEANWEDAPLVPAFHPIDERFSYTGVDVPPFGGLGRTYQVYNRVVKNE